ncbi:hypothetical protein INT47_001186 [Mucor saturninus]|uniref:Uncharacterized protein n=1 Tax=Mucor saturninus TaxID=64648 RepID=A0A8H7RMS7_9FUNG|nr:hypothetical protein INT47_001186 [Mucor saturninus]
MASFAEKLRKLFCCASPGNFDEPIVDRRRGAATTDPVSTANIAPEQEAVPQDDLHPATWEDPIRSPVDLSDIEQVGTTVKRPDDLEQAQLFPVSWEGSNKARTVWSEESTAPEWEEDDQESKDSVRKLPLPWEGKRGLVPFDGKTYGPSWAELPVEINQPQDLDQDSQKPGKSSKDDSDQSVKEMKKDGKEDTRTQVESGPSTAKIQTQVDDMATVSVKKSDSDKTDSDVIDEAKDKTKDIVEDIQKSVDHESELPDKTTKKSDEVTIDHHDEETSGYSKASIKQE